MEAIEYFGSFIAMDDPRHARQRLVVGSAFTPRRLAALVDSVETICSELIDDMCEKGEVDLVAGDLGAVPAARDLRHDGHPTLGVQDGPRRVQHHPGRRRHGVPRRPGPLRGPPRGGRNAGRAHERAGRGAAEEPHR